jgi:hypothetical protein
VGGRATIRSRCVAWRACAGLYQGNILLAIHTDVVSCVCIAISAVVSGAMVRRWGKTGVDGRGDGAQASRDPIAMQA